MQTEQKNNTATSIPRCIVGPKGRLPVQAKYGDAGYDICSSETITIKAGERICVPTDIKVAIPVGFYGRINDRSSMALKYISTCGGVIDAGYRGEVKILLHNYSTQDFQIAIGDKIAQMIIKPCMIAKFEQVDELDITDRGDGGFGSTGKN
jgi:dUTP pyrophosphatase